MKFDKLFDIHTVTGIVIGLVLGLYHPMGAYKEVLVILAVVLGFKALTTK